MATSTKGSWSTCKKCGTFEWNEVLLTRDCKCRKCNSKVKLYKGKSKGGVSAANTLVDPSTQEPSVQGLLSQALAITKDPNLKKTLEQEVSKQASPSAAASVSPAEAVRRAEGVWKDASLRYDQAASQVQRCQDNLAKAKDKEKEALRALATAELSRKVAAKALALVTGVVPNGATGGAGTAATASAGAQDSKGQFIELQWDTKFFEGLDNMDCNPEERETLRQLEKDLQAAKSQFTAKADEIAKWKSSMEELQRAIEDRMAKKRRVAEGADGNSVPTAGGGAASGAADAAPPVAPAAAPRPEEATEPTGAEIEREMEKIRQARATAKAAAAEAKPVAGEEVDPDLTA